MQTKQITTQEEARQYAVDWQYRFSDRSISYGELAEESAMLRELAVKFDLIEEFEESGII